MVPCQRFADRDRQGVRGRKAERIGGIGEAYDSKHLHQRWRGSLVSFLAYSRDGEGVQFLEAEEKKDGDSRRTYE